MAEIICPICETPNEPDASHCVVCGERLTPAAEGEEISPEENVSAMVGELDEESYAEQAALAEESDAVDLDSFDDELEVDPSEPGEAPAALYSSVDGTAYPQGSPEYEEGYGPLGEELVAQPPGSDLPSDEGVEEGTAAEDDDYQLDEVAPAAGFEGIDDEFDDYDAQGEIGEELSAAAEAAEAGSPESTGPSERFQQAFEARRKQRPSSAPLPTPGVLAESATLTVYHERQPVLTHDLDTDETLIGRRDPVSDTYPDLDVEDYDEGAHISRKHAYVYRQNRNYTLYVVSNAGTQLNSELLNLGDRRTLADGDIIVLAGAIALRFALPEDQETVVSTQEAVGAVGAPEDEAEPLSVELEELEVEPVHAGMNADELEPLSDDYMADDELE